MKAIKTKWRVVSGEPCVMCGNDGRALDPHGECRRCDSDPPTFPVGTVVMAGRHSPSHRGVVTRCKWKHERYRYAVDFDCGHYDDCREGAIRRVTS